MREPQAAEKHILRTCLSQKGTSIGAQSWSRLEGALLSLSLLRQLRMHSDLLRGLGKHFFKFPKSETLRLFFISPTRTKKKKRQEGDLL